MNPGSPSALRRQRTPALLVNFVFFVFFACLPKRPAQAGDLALTFQLKMKTSLFALLLCISVSAYCQEVINPRPLTMAEYEKAKGFEIKNLDQDTYVKFEN